MASSTPAVELSDTVRSALDYLEENLGFKRGSFLGKGTYGSVVKIMSPDSVPLAAKVVQRKMLNELEVRVWPLLRHENVLRLIHVINDLEGAVIFLTDLMGTNLFMRLQNREFKQDPKAPERCRTYATQVLSGISYLHRQKLCHLDLRAENVFLSAEDDRAVVADFSGLSWSEHLKKYCPLPHSLRPPELLVRKNCNRVSPQPVDLWSCGLLIANMFLGKGFYVCTVKNNRAGHIDAVRQYTELFQCEEYVKRFFRETYSSHSFSQTCVKNFISLVRRFLEINPLNRMKADEALSHPFLLHHSVRKVKGKEVLVKVNFNIPSIEKERAKDCLIKADNSDEFQVTIFQESEKIDSIFVNKSSTVKDTKTNRWSRYKRRLSQFKLPFRSVPFLKSMRFKKEDKKKSKKSVKENEKEFL